MPITSYAAQYDDKTPEDTYHQTVQLAAVVKILLQQNSVSVAWPIVVVQGKKRPRHAYQKALEVLSKINRYRQIHKLGPVSTPPYPSRDVTPNEVFDFVQRLAGEVNMLLSEDEIAQYLDQSQDQSHFTPADVYRELWAISKAFDPLLGVRGFSPADVFAQSEHIIELVRFLRVTQDMPGMPEKPLKPKGKHPNHALASTYQLLDKISQAESRLWMQPVEVPQMEKRVITPTEVYDQLQTVIAELQRIKFRLGVERPLSKVVVRLNKTPDDVIQNLQWASLGMPPFRLDRQLKQYDPTSLEKSSDDVFAIAQLVLLKLKYYKRMRGIRVRANTSPAVSGLKPRHVYQKILENLKKVMELRRQAGFGSSAVPLFPMRPISPNEVFALSSRLDRELNLIYGKSSVHVNMYTIDEFEQKTPNDVFKTMWQISYELDTILGTQGQTPNDVYQMVVYVGNHIKLLGRHMGYELKGERPSFRAGLEPADVIEKARRILRLIGKIKERAGMFSASAPMPVQGEKVTPNDVFNLVGVIGAELTEVEIHFGISNQLTFPPVVHGKTPSHVYQQLAYAESLLEEIMRGYHYE